MQRRDFLNTTLAAALLLQVDAPAFAKKVGKLGRARLKVGILSDIHVKMNDPGSVEMFEKALNYYKDARVDAVLIAGDMADTGSFRELKLVADTWYRVFPGDSYPDGTPVEKLFIYGNHDIEAWKYSIYKKREDYQDFYSDRIALDKAKAWEEAFHEPWAPIYIKDVKGYKFIAGHYVNSKRIAGLKEFFRDHESELPGPGKPFFYFQHSHPKGTCSGPWVWGQDNGESTEILSSYPNVVAFSGHSHTMLSDERVIWQGAFTSVGTASLSYVGGIGGRENSTTFFSSNTSPLQMPVVRCREAHHGQLMTVYDDCITLQRHEFGRDEDLGENWIIPIDVSRRTLTFESRAAQDRAPRFRPGTTVSVRAHQGKDRSGASRKQLAVSFATAPRTGDTPRALDYEICVEVEDVDTWKTVLTKRVYSPTVFMSEKADAGGEAVCEFGLFELPQERPLRFAVRPCSCFGHKGEPVFSQTLTIDKQEA